MDNAKVDLVLNLVFSFVYRL